MRTIALLAAFFAVLATTATGQFRVHPYLQNPDPHGMSILWFSESSNPGTVTLSQNGGVVTGNTSSPELAETLFYDQHEVFDDGPPSLPYRHQVRFVFLDSDSRYDYVVEQDGATFSGHFQTPTDQDDGAIRFIAYADTETEQASVGRFPVWPKPDGTDNSRRYPIDEDQGYKNNLDVMRSRRPDFIVIAGDLTQVGLQQRHWDEFWNYNTGPDESSTIAGTIPLFPVPGNHEYYAGPRYEGLYPQPAAEHAISKYTTYFEFPSNGSPIAEQEGRYYRTDYGPVTLIGLDVCNNGANESQDDTNFWMRGEKDSGGGKAPDFSPGSRQYEWLEEQLQDAQQNSRFTFIHLHHTPLSEGVHNLVPGWTTDEQSGQPVRMLLPLLHRYGVDAVFAGHDEMFERSLDTGQELLPDGSTRASEINVFTVGIGGDGLRGPHEDAVNPKQQFIAHRDAPEVWDGNRLVSGGKHYGHVEVNIAPLGGAMWEARFEPVHVFPLLDADGEYQGFERRVYDDVVTLQRSFPSGVSTDWPIESGSVTVGQIFPNPAVERLTLGVRSGTSTVGIEMFDALGRVVRSEVRSVSVTEETNVVVEVWDLPAGVYFVRVGGSAARRVVIG